MGRLMTLLILLGLLTLAGIATMIFLYQLAYVLISIIAIGAIFGGLLWFANRSDP